jgi:hypothetical protein
VTKSDQQQNSKNVTEKQQNITKQKHKNKTEEK